MRRDDEQTQKTTTEAQRLQDREKSIAQVRFLQYWDNVWTPSRTRRVRVW